jgi:phage tail sheath protein FI
MVTLVSPGVAVTVVDESAYASPGTGTIPLIIIATAQDKTDPTGTEIDGIAKYTKAANAGLVVPVTSQREITQFFGDPTFAEAQGAETSEYGLLAAYSYLGQGSQAYIVRADVDLNELIASDQAPTGPVAANTIWLDTDGSSYGVHEWSGTSWVSQTVTVETALNATAGEVADPSTYAPTATVTDGDYLVAVIYDSAAPTGLALGYFVGNAGAWVALDDAGATTLSNAITYAEHYEQPTTPAATDVWIKTTQPGSGLNLVLYRADALGQFDLIEVEAVETAANSGVHVAQDGSSLTDITSTLTNTNAVISVPAITTAGLVINTVAGGTLSPITVAVAAQESEPTGPTTAGQIWFDDTETDLDIIRKTNGDWERVDADDIQYSTKMPSLDKDGNALTTSDIWVETDATEGEYPKLYRWDGTQWLLHDNSDQSTDRGVLFGDVTDIGRATVPSGTFTTAQIFQDAPDPLLYPSDMLVVNMSLSQNTLREWTEGVLYADGSTTTDAWLNAVSSKADGSGSFGRLAQRRYIATKMQGAVAGNEDLRDPNRNFTLLTAPNFPELTDELVTLNSDRGETGFIIIDTPMRLSPTQATNWILGVGASENGDEGLVTKNTYSAVYYPSGRSTTPAGDTVTVPASHMVLYTYAYNDNVAYPWFAPAGLTRGVVQNGSAVGYITPEEEFKAVSLSQGQRDAAYVNKLNPIANFPREGVVVFGQKTLHPVSSALDRVNVARLVAYLRERFDEIARPLLFEANDKLTRDRAVVIFENFMSDLLAKRAVTDFAVVCDESNNTPIRIDRNELYIDVAIAPTKAIEFIYIPIRIVNTGAL